MARERILGAVLAVLGIVAGAVVTVLFARYPELGDWFIWVGAPICALCIIYAVYLMFAPQKPQGRQIPEDDRPTGPVGIYIGKHARNITTDNNKFVGFDNPIIDHGSNNQHKNNESYRTGAEYQNEENPKSSSNIDSPKEK